MAPPVPAILGWGLQARLCEQLAKALADDPPTENPAAVRQAQARIAPALVWTEAHPVERTTLARLAASCGDTLVWP